MQRQTRISGIYAIRNIQNNKLYIGSSSNIEKRWRFHKYELGQGRHHSSHLQNAWNKYGEPSFEFKIILICETFDLIRYEQKLIDCWHPAYNSSPTAGSPLGITRSSKTREKIRRTKLGVKRKPFSAIHIANLGAAKVGKKRKPFSAEHRARLGASKMGNKNRLGQKHSLETRAKMSAAKIGKKRKPFSAEHRARLSEAKAGGTRIGHEPSPETRAKISAAKKGKSFSAEHRANLSTSHMGHEVSQETRAKISAAQKKRLLDKANDLCLVAIPPDLTASANSSYNDVANTTIVIS